MVDKFRGPLYVGELRAADDAKALDMPDGADVRSGANVVARLNVGRVVLAGDADATLAVAGDSTSDIDGTLLLYEVPITALRTVTLTAAGAVAGMTYRVTRQAAATGAFDVDVGGLKSLTAASQWCEVVFDGSAWVLSANGSL